MRRLNKLGFGLVYRDPNTGELIVDTDNIRAAPAASTGFFGGLEEEDDDDYADFGEDDDDDDYADFGEEDDENSEFGRRRRRRPRRRRREGHRPRRRGSRRPRRKPEVAAPTVRPNQGHWGTTAVGGTDKNNDGGAVSVKVRLQHDFRARDITFNGSSDDAKVTSIFFGDRVVWSNSDGIAVSVFSSNSNLRNFLKGQSLRAGLDITVNGDVGDAGQFSVTLIGDKPVQPHC